MAITRVTVNGAGGSSNWTGAYTDIDEGTASPSDADYIEGGASKVAWYTLEDMPSDFEGAIEVTILSRHRNTVTKGDNVDLSQIQIFESNETTALTSLYNPGGTATFTTYSSVVSVTGSTAKSAWDGARVKIATNGGASGVVQLSAIDFDIRYTATGESTETLRPNSNVNSVWSANSYTLVDDAVNNPTAGSGDIAIADEDDDNEEQIWGCTALSGSITTANYIKVHVRHKDDGVSDTSSLVRAKIGGTWTSQKSIGFTGTYSYQTAEWSGTWNPVNDFQIGITSPSIGSRREYHVDVTYAEVTGFSDSGETYNETATGGSESAGSSSPETTYTITATGGAESAGESLPTGSVSEIATGGSLLAGESLPSNNITEIATGGSLLSGESTTTGNASEIATGGSLLSGESFPTGSVSEIATGGSLLAGESVPTGSDIVATGGAALGGTTTVLPEVICLTASPREAANDGSTNPWNNIENIFASDDTWASCVPTGFGITDLLQAKDFGFSFPDNANHIVEISVTIETHSSHYDGGHSGKRFNYQTVSLLKNGNTAGIDKTDSGGYGGSWGTTDSTWTFNKNIGIASDPLWDETWTIEEIESSGFGLEVSAVENNGSGDVTAYIDHITITVCCQLNQLDNTSIYSNSGTGGSILAGSATVQYVPVGGLGSNDSSIEYLKASSLAIKSERRMFSILYKGKYRNANDRTNPLNRI